MRIYNLFPLLCGTFPEWKSHIKRAAEMEFDWVFVNPVQQPGHSGSLYSIADYFALNPQLIDSAESITGESQLRHVAQYARELKMRLMVDLVINHCAVDAAIVQEHPNWFIFEADGRVSNPHCKEDGKKVVWRDLARFNHRTKEEDELIAFYLKIIEYLIGLGFATIRGISQKAEIINTSHRSLNN
ncbi:MAG: hypothetical protein JRJ00_03950 [Deltaproteobacteria bacterium]|nr:hypothetical protein [Deltaproteobacteria bacterium]